MQTTQHRSSDDPACPLRGKRKGRSGGSLEAQCAVRPRTIVVGCVLPQNPSQVLLIDDDDMVQALSAQGAYHSFRHGVGLGPLHRGQYGLDGKSSCAWSI